MPRGNQKSRTSSNTQGRFKIRQTTSKHSKTAGSSQVLRAVPRPPK